MKKPTKYVNVHVVQGNYNGHWDDECCSETWKEVLDDVKSYRENVPQYRYRVITHRVIREKFEVGEF